MKTAFWTAIVITVLFLLGIYVEPVAGLLYVICFSFVAWGIHRRQRWAAIAGAVCILLPLITILGDGDRSAMYVAIPFHLVMSILLFRGATDRTGSSAVVLPWAILILCAALLRLTTHAFVVPTGAMEETVLIGDRILVRTVAVNPSQGDIVALHYPIDRKQIFIKRVIGMPGDHIRIQHKQLFVNGKASNETYVRHKTDYEDPYRDNFPSEPDNPIYPPAAAMLKDNVQGRDVVVPAGRYFVMGDSRDLSLDSRYWGFITRSDIIGKPLFIYSSNDLPMDDLTKASILNMRWNRVFKFL